MLSTTLNNPLPHVRESGSRQAYGDTLKALPYMHALEIAIDLVTACLSFATIYYIFHRISHPSFMAQPMRHVVAVGLLVSCVAVLLLDRAGAYKASGGLLQVRETASILEAATLSAFVLLPCLFLFGNHSWAALCGAEIPTLAICLIVQRHLMHSALGSFRKKVYGMSRVLIYGAGWNGRMLYSALSRSPKLGLLPVAIIDDGSGNEGLHIHESSYRRRRFLVSTGAAFRESLIRNHRADLVIVASRPNSEEEIQFILQESESAGAAVAFAADPKAMEFGEVDYVDLDGQLLYNVHRPRRKHLHEAASRIFDLIVSCIAITAFTPLFALISVLIKIDSPGPIFFRQVRIGKHGHPFRIFKFRTMHAAQCGDGVSPRNTLDPRITRVGRWLRKSSIDELPQLLNILHGSMGFVGPRPEMPFIVDQYTVEQSQRLTVKPGLTGIWQISADRCRPIHDNLHYDLYYIKHRSVFMDIAIIFHTLLFAMHGT
ncbi:exopolysaccharide biosynthesis polyprenyl glycosylphosphotransferase [Granulicella arctica]|uniref:exopolysaccharide biosynthesis polyprenyl glycosylphosphotransferase n=1 Tax=Granulicella arctica TaxID=940613 RepID=UPI0021E0020D|nr:exopolysaccharide biosynthesis polyprenyl glycosylphosphotransferase [Granulicella arctica]